MPERNNKRDNEDSTAEIDDDQVVPRNETSMTPSRRLHGVFFRGSTYTIPDDHPTHGSILESGNLTDEEYQQYIITHATEIDHAPPKLFKRQC
jgi:hypothetical protein